jgi:hypothetical protein
MSPGVLRPLLTAIAGRGSRRRPAPRFAGIGAASVITLRLEDETEAPIGGLVELSGAERPHGPSLVAAVDGEPRAALSLADGQLMADPFHPSAELGSLLELRRAQLEASHALDQPRCA